MDQSAADQPNASNFETRRFGDVVCVRSDCLEALPTLTPKSVSLCFADLPYASTQCSWDIAINKDRFWQLLPKVLLNNSYAIFTANMRLSANLIHSSSLPFCYDLVYVKAQGMGHFSANKKPLCAHENILVFGQGKKTYNPIKTANTQKKQGVKLKTNSEAAVYGAKFIKTEWSETGLRFPVSLVCPAMPKPERGLHPTQKPVALLEWLIATYTNPGDLILDPTAGSGTTGVAALNLGRRAILIEKDPTYFEVMCNRIAEHQQKMEAARE